MGRIAEHSDNGDPQVKHFRTHIHEIAKAEIQKGSAPPTMKANRYIANRKDGAKGDNAVRMGQIGDEYAVWEFASSDSNTVQFFVVHRPSNTVAAVLDTTPKTEGNSTNLYVEMLSVKPELRRKKIGFSIPQALYKFLGDVGYSLQSGSAQSEGGAAVWKGLVSDPELLERTWIAYADGSEEKYTPDKAHKVWVDVNLDDLYLKRAKISGQKGRIAYGKSELSPQERAEIERLDREEQEVDSEMERASSTLVMKPKGKPNVDGWLKRKADVRSAVKGGKQFAPGTTWKTPSGKWGGKRKDGTVDYFDSEADAQAWVNPRRAPAINKVKEK